MSIQVEDLLIYIRNKRNLRQKNGSWKVKKHIQDLLQRAPCADDKLVVIDFVTRR